MKQRLYSSKKVQHLNQEIVDLKQIEVVKKIAQGAFGTVYLAEDKLTKKQYAIKKFFVGQSSDKDKVKANQEINIQCLFKHKNVVKIVGQDWQDQLCSIYLEYCQYDLQQFIQSSFYPLNHEEIKTIAFHILSALSSIHSKEIIHRDLKPSNIMINEDGISKIGDFGSATIKKETYSNEGFSKWYTAPELLFGSRSYQQEIDIWSFACIYGELINGIPLFPGQGEIEQILLIGQALGSANESNWPSIIKMPDYGKINFKQSDAKDLKDLFPLADMGELDLMSKVLRYENRATAQDLLKTSYFLNVKDNIKVGPWISEKIQMNPYFNYIDLIKDQ